MPAIKGEWKECPPEAKEKSKYVLDRENPRIATKVVDDLFCRSTVVGNTLLPPNTVSSWNIKVRKSKYNNGGDIYVGVAPSDVNQCDDHNRNRCGWYIELHLVSLCSGPPHKYSFQNYAPSNKICIRDGDSVGVIMDTTKGELSFAMKGVILGVAYKGIPLDKPLVPCVILGRGDTSVELELSEVKDNVDSTIPAPSNITTKSETWGSITLTWDKVEKATFYQVEADGAGTWELATSGTFSMAGFLPETEHSLRVRTVRDNKVGEWSSAVIGKTLNKSFETGMWKECPTSFDTFYKYFLDDENRSVKSLKHYSWRTVVWDAALPPNEIHTWKISAYKMDKDNENDIYIGVAPTDIDLSNQDNYKECGWYFGIWAATLHSGPPHKYAWRGYGVPNNERHKLRNDREVIVMMDTARGELSFAFGGVNCGVAYEGIPLDKPLAPCVIMYNEGDSILYSPSTMPVITPTLDVSVPQNLRVRAMRWDFITLEWDANSDGSFYQLEVDGSKSWFTTFQTYFTVSRLEQGTGYTFRVRSVNKHNNASEWGDPIREVTEKYHAEEWAWKKCPDYVEKEKKYALNKKNPRIATSLKGNSVIIGNSPLLLNSVTAWGVKIVEHKRKDIRLSIGVAPLDIDQNDECSSGNYGWYYYCHKSFLSSGLPHDYRKKNYGPKKEDGEYVHIGDTVGVVMDTTKGELSFVLDGINRGVAFKGIPLDKPLVPCVIPWYSCTLALVVGGEEDVDEKKDCIIS